MLKKKNPKKPQNKPPLPLQAHTACKHSSALNPATVEVSLKLKALARAVRDEKRAQAAAQVEEKLVQSSSNGGGEAEVRAAIEVSGVMLMMGGRCYA